MLLHRGSRLGCGSSCEVPFLDHHVPGRTVRFARRWPVKRPDSVRVFLAWGRQSQSFAGLLARGDGFRVWRSRGRCTRAAADPDRFLADRHLVGRHAHVARPRGEGALPRAVGALAMQRGEAMRNPRGCAPRPDAPDPRGISRRRGLTFAGLKQRNAAHARERDAEKSRRRISSLAWAGRLQDFSFVAV